MAGLVELSHSNNGEEKLETSEDTNAEVPDHLEEKILSPNQPLKKSEGALGDPTKTPVIIESSLDSNQIQNE